MEIRKQNYHINTSIRPKKFTPIRARRLEGLEGPKANLEISRSDGAIRVEASSSETLGAQRPIIMGLRVVGSNPGFQWVLGWGFLLGYWYLVFRLN